MDGDNNFLISAAPDIFIDRRADLRIVPSEDSVFDELRLAGPAAQLQDDALDTIVDQFIKAPMAEEGPSELLLKFDLLNEGLSGVSALDADDFTIDVYAATTRDETPSPERLISSFVVENGIAAGSRYTFEETTAVPEHIDAGSFYYINVVVDGTDVIAESDEEDNNTFSRDGSVFVGDVSLEVALNDATYWKDGAPLHLWDTSFQVPTQIDATLQAPFFGSKQVYAQDNPDSGVRASAQTGPVPEGGESWLQKTVKVDGSELLVSFQWKVSSQRQVTTEGVFEDILQFSIRYEGESEFTEIVYISGEQDWADYIYRITQQGTHTLRWSYIENGDGTRGGDDAGWIDDYSEASYDFVPTFKTPVAASYDAGDTIELPVFVWNLGELRIPDSGIPTTIRLVKEKGDISNLDWSASNAEDVVLHTVAYSQLLVEDLVYLKTHFEAIVGSDATDAFDATMNAAITALLDAEAGEIEPELSDSEINDLRAVLQNEGSWRQYDEQHFELLMASESTEAEQASRKRFFPVRTFQPELVDPSDPESDQLSANQITIPNQLSESAVYYIGIWANYQGAITESDFSNNLLYSAGANVSLNVANTIPEVLEQVDDLDTDTVNEDNNPNLLDDVGDWTLTGDGRWFAVTDEEAENRNSLSSPTESLAQGAAASIVTRVEGPKLIRFAWRGDFENSADVATFYVNDVPVNRESQGVEQWRH